MIKRVRYPRLAIAGVIAFLLGIPFLRPSKGGAAQPPVIQPGHLSVVAFTPVEAGRYLVLITACNDCHTSGWKELPGSAPESLWLTGDPVGFAGPWGTSYASNLRRFVKDFNADTWVQVMRARNSKPPMPWNALHAMSDADLRAIFEYIKSLGPAGDVMPADTPPNVEPKTPYVWMIPQVPGNGWEKRSQPEPTTQK
jgi:mono/diheme cytochrome c family protein